MSAAIDATLAYAATVKAARRKARVLQVSVKKFDKEHKRAFEAYMAADREHELVAYCETMQELLGQEWWLD